MSFEAVLNTTHTEGRVKFDRVDLNDGGRYDASSGEFRCLESMIGKYFFSFVMVSDKLSGPCNAHMLKNNTVLSDVVLKEEPTETVGVSTGMAVTECGPGEGIYVETYSCSTGQLALGQTRFSGIYIR